MLLLQSAIVIDPMCQADAHVWLIFSPKHPIRLLYGNMLSRVRS